MKTKLLLAFTSMLFLFQKVFSQTQVSGGIFSNTSWTLANSPYLMTGNVVVFPGVTLTIEPGVEVRVKENPIIDKEYYLETRGTINMVGTPTAKITFRAQFATNSVGTWKGIIVKNSQGGEINYDYVSISNSYKSVSYDSNIPNVIKLHESTFKYNAYAVLVGRDLFAENCIFFANRSAVYGWSNFEFENCIFDSNMASLGIYASSFKMNNCTVKNNDLGIRFNSGAVNGVSIKNTLFENNIIALDNANNGLLDSCLFIGNDEGLINTSDMVVRNSNFSNNKKALLVGFSTSVMRCNILDNETGIALGAISVGQPKPIVENNKICYNTLYNIDNQTDLNMFIPTNCFCTSDTKLIEDKIFDGYDDITKGLVSYAIFDTTCTIVTVLVNKTQANGLNEIVETSSVFPNPFNENLNINNVGSYQQFKIFTIQGHLIQEGKLVRGENNLDMSHILAGSYVLGLYDLGQNSRFIKIVHQ